MSVSPRHLVALGLQNAFDPPILFVMVAVFLHAPLGYTETLMRIYPKVVAVLRVMHL